MDRTQKSKILEKVKMLYKMWKDGKLGGEYMPEDSNPHLIKSSRENFLYFTLPMALNYQRNSYKLWENALATFNDKTTSFVFDVEKVLDSEFEKVKTALTKYKVALQPTKQTEIWIKLCKTINEKFDGDIRNLFNNCDFDINKIRNYIQFEYKKDFPYLSGNKICNYWLYVLYQYADAKYQNLQDLTIAPDTHVIQATRKLEIINDEEYSKSNVQHIVIQKWNELLKDTEFCPIDLHTPLWLWSRNGFKEIKSY